MEAPKPIVTSAIVARLPAAAHPTKGEVGELITEFVLLTVELILLDLEENHDPYGAKAARLINGLKERIAGKPGGPSPR